MVIMNIMVTNFYIWKSRQQNCLMLRGSNKKHIKKSERAGPHQIGQKGQLVKRSLGPKSQILNPRSRIPNPQFQIPGPRIQIQNM